MLNFVALLNRVAEHYYIFVASSSLRTSESFRLRHLRDEYVEKEVRYKSFCINLRFVL